RQRLTSPAQTTSLDMRHQAKPSVGAPFWYVRYKDKNGKLSKAKLTYNHVLKRVRAGKISLKTEASPLPGGAFRPLGSYAVFQDIDVALAKTKTTPDEKPAEPTAEPSPSEDDLTRRRHWWIIALCAGVT